MLGACRSNRPTGPDVFFVPRLSSPVLRPSSLVLRKPPSPVPRPKVGNPMGAEPPWSSGKESRGNRLEIGSLWRVFAYFLHVEKVGRRRRRDMAANSRDKRRIRRKAGGSSAAAGITSQSSGFRETPDAGSPFWGACFARCGGDGNRTREFRLRATPFLSAEKWGKDAPGGPFHKGPPGPLLTAKGLRPIGSPAGFYERRRTKDERRRTGVRTGVTDCHSRGWAPASQ